MRKMLLTGKFAELVSEAKLHIKSRSPSLGANATLYGEKAAAVYSGSFGSIFIALKARNVRIRGWRQGDVIGRVGSDAGHAARRRIRDLADS